jgi:L-asparaginase II
MMQITLERGELVESRHRVHLAAVRVGEAPVAWSGNPRLVTFVRSAAKPFQALPLVEEGAVERWQIPSNELALCCASHSGEPVHIEGVRRLLDRIDVSEEELECGPQLPTHQPSAHALLARGEAPMPIHNNCSGKHAGMLALARHLGWARRGYRRSGHPVQERMVAEVARWTGLESEEIVRGVDGCGVVCFGLPLEALALAFARLGEAAKREEKGSVTVLEAMVAHPFHVAGSGRLCTRLMEVTEGRTVAKLGAEGVYAALDRRQGIGIALKVEDGARRACEVALLESLYQLGSLEPGERESLSEWVSPPVLNTRGEAAAHLRSQGSLEGPGTEGAR